MWIRWSVAAAAMIVVFATLSYLLNSNNKPISTAARAKTQTDRFKNDIAPGQAGAVLILSNGKKIILDTADNGSLAEEKGTEIVKQDDQIIYADQSGRSEVLYNSMTTPRGRQFKVVLADGSNVWLNA